MKWVSTSHHKLNINITMHHTQRETQDLVRSNTAATNELLYELLSSQKEMETRLMNQMQSNSGDATDHTKEVSSGICIHLFLDRHMSFINYRHCEKIQVGKIILQTLKGRLLNSRKCRKQALYGDPMRTN